MQSYGKELILDLKNCDPATFTRKDIRRFFKRLCEEIDMERCEYHFWDDLHTPEEEKETEPHLVGTSAIQFIKTSSIVIHTLDILKTVYLNIFSCKDFSHVAAMHYSANYFGGEIASWTVVKRGRK